MTKIVALLAAAIAAAGAMAQTPGSVKVIVPEGTQEITVSQQLLADMEGAMWPAADTVDVAGMSVYELPLDPDGAMAFWIDKVDRPVNGVMPAKRAQAAILFAAPGETITVDLGKDPVEMTGSELMDGITAWAIESDSLLAPLRAGAEVSDEQRQAAYDAYLARVKAVAAANRDNALGVYMLTRIPDRDARIEAYEALGPGAAASILAPMYKEMGKDVERIRARAKAAERVKEGLPAPDFTLPDPEGKTVSLSDFKGKWVMLDFWGSWCGWCIKGIPQMKEEWAKMKDSNVVYLSIDCGDTRDKWLAALKQYELPWVNVWADPDAPEQVSTLYAIEGFPTKFVIDPEGKIALKVVGEDPSFYDRFREAMK